MSKFKEIKYSIPSIYHKLKPIITKLYTIMKYVETDIFLPTMAKFILGKFTMIKKILNQVTNQTNCKHCFIIKLINQPSKVYPRKK